MKNNETMKVSKEKIRSTIKSTHPDSEVEG